MRLDSTPPRLCKDFMGVECMSKSSPVRCTLQKEKRKNAHVYKVCSPTVGTGDALRRKISRNKLK